MVDGDPGTAALMTSRDAMPGLRRLLASVPPTFAARIGLLIGFDRPGTRLAHITAPTLSQVCRPDTVARIE
ncbi:hypothetical protein OKHIL_47630 [Mycolicibacterium mageritense]|nr:hypothetical protein MTY414_71620 [Mycolicibacterium mageritense]